NRDLPRAAWRRRRTGRKTFSLILVAHKDDRVPRRVRHIDGHRPCQIGQRPAAGIQEFDRHAVRPGGRLVEAKLRYCGRFSQARVSAAGVVAAEKILLMTPAASRPAPTSSAALCRPWCPARMAPLMIAAVP